MTDIIIPVATVWDILASALDDGWFWLLAGSGALVIALIIRRRLGRLLRCRSPRSYRPSAPSWDG